MGIYSQFCETRSVLFSNDVASRGLDFNKAVDWVVQVNCRFFQMSNSLYVWVFNLIELALIRWTVLKMLQLTYTELDGLL